MRSQRQRWLAHDGAKHKGGPCALQARYQVVTETAPPDDMPHEPAAIYAMEDMVTLDDYGPSSDEEDYSAGDAVT